MSPQLINLMVTRDHAVPVEPMGGSALVTVDQTGGTVFYADNPQVSPSSNQGSIAPGGSQSFTGQVWLISSAVAGVQIQVTGAVAASGGSVESTQTIPTAGASQTLTLPASGKQTFDLTASAASCTLTFAGATGGTVALWTLVLRQDGTGNRTWLFPAAVRWPNGALPPLSTTPAAYDVITVLSTDGGTTLTAVLGATNTSTIAVPAAPTLTVNPGNTLNTLAWVQPYPGGGPITNYLVQRSTTAGTEVTVQTLGASTFTFTDSGLTNGQQYFYKLIAQNIAGNSPQSAEVSATPTALATPDFSSNNWVVTQQGSPTALSKVASPLSGFGQALVLPTEATTAAMLTLPTSVGIAGPFTLEAAIKNASAPSVEQGIIAKWGTAAADDNVYLFLSAAGVLSGTFINTAGATVGPIQLGNVTDTTTMHWVAYTWDGTTHRLYLDGTMTTSGTSGAGSGIRLPTTGAPFCIGGRNPTNAPFLGTIDEARISSTARYTGASYTVPSAPLVNDAATVALVHMD